MKLGRSLVCVLAACGGGGTDAPSAPDATAADGSPIVDAAIDGAAPCDRPGGAVTLRTRPMMDVLVHGADGAIVATTHSGTTGEVSVDVPACGMVSLVRISTQVRSTALTWTHVRGGDALAYGAPIAEPRESQSTTLSFEPVAGASAHSFGGCAIAAGGRPGFDIDCQGTNAADSPASFYLHGFGTPATAPIFGLARGQGSTTLAYAFAPAVRVGGTFAMPAWRTDFESVPATLANVPSGMSLLLAPPRLFSGPFSFSGPLQPPLVDDAGTYTTTLSLPLELPARTVTAYVDANTSGLGDNLSLIARSVATAPVNIDVAAEMLPMIEAFQVTAAGEVSWTIGAAADAADAVVIDLLSETLQWNLVTPANVRGVQLPQLPSQIAATPPPSMHGLFVIDVDGIDGHAAAIGRVDELSTVAFRPAPYRLSTAGDFDALLIDFR